MEPGVGFIAAFGAGILSFVSPCVLPLVPGYISFISGASLEELQEGRAETLRKACLASLFFGAGFTIVFVLLGASATAIGQLLFSRVGLLRKVAGGLIVLFGLHMAGVLRIPFLDRERRLHLSRGQPALLRSVVLGGAFAFGWTPCLGPILGAILTYAGTQETVREGAALLFTYSLGLGVPFFLAALGAGRFLRAFQRLRPYLGGLRVISGVFLIALGVLVYSNSLQWLAYYFAS